MSSKEFHDDGEDNWRVVRLATGGTLLAVCGLSAVIMTMGAVNETQEPVSGGQGSSFEGETSSSESSSDTSGLGLMCLAAAGGAVLMAIPGRKNQVTYVDAATATMHEALPLDLRYLVNKEIAPLDFPTPAHLED